MDWDMKLWSVVKVIGLILVASAVSLAVAVRTVDIRLVQNNATEFSSIATRLSRLEASLAEREEQSPEQGQEETGYDGPLKGKKIVYDGDSIAAAKESNGGAYGGIIARVTGGISENHAHGGARLCANEERHSVVNSLEDLPKDGDLYCFEGGINDFWGNTPIGEIDPKDYTGDVDPYTICGAMETIFRYCLTELEGKPVCFVIVHKIQNTAVSPNANGDTFQDYHDAMVAVCEKYSIPYYDAFLESGLNGWNEKQSELYLNANSEGTSDGIHPNESGYRRYYVQQLIDLFETILPCEE